MDSDNGHPTNYSPRGTSEPLMPILTGSYPIQGIMQRPHEKCDQGNCQLQQVTFETLPDDVLLKIFKFFIDAMQSHGSASNEWHLLVHVCRRWRYLAFSSPRYLNLQLVCEPPRRSVKEMLDIWPELPICIYTIGSFLLQEKRDDCIAALGLNHRVSGIRLEDTSEPAWDIFMSLMQHPFPALTHLWVQPNYSMMHTISRSFLGGSAPSLRDLRLTGVPFPALPELLSSATNLVCLWYDNIPPSGYISPQAMVAGLSALAQLESLSLEFPSYRDLHEPTRVPPPHTRILLPALTNLCLQGSAEYMEELASRIDAPSLESLGITLFYHYQEVLGVAELAKFVRRADKLSLIDRADISFGCDSDSFSVILSQEFLEGKIDPKTLVINFPYGGWDSRVSYLAELWASCFPTPSSFQCLHMDAPVLYPYVVDEPNPQWLEILRPLSAVKELRLSSWVASRVAQALRELPAEQVIEVLPALEIIFISELQHLEHAKEAISEFVDARQLHGRPVSIHQA